MIEVLDRESWCSKRGMALFFTLPGTCEAMDGRARAHMDVLVAFPGRVKNKVRPRIDNQDKKPLNSRSEHC
jgi:hypothetical protein